MIGLLMTVAQMVFGTQEIRKLALNRSLPAIISDANWREAACEGFTAGPGANHICSYFSPFSNADSRAATLSRSSRNRTPDRRLGNVPRYQPE